MNNQTKIEHDLPERLLISPSTCLHVDQNADFYDLYEAVAERMGKADTVLRLTFDSDKFQDLPHEVVSYLLWAVDSLIVESRTLHNRMWKAYQQEGQEVAKPPEGPRRTGESTAETADA